MPDIGSFLGNVLLGLQVATTPENLFYCFVGVFVGTVVGVLPGIGTLATMSLLLPFTFYLDPTPAIVMLAGVYYGSSYGGSTASILLNLPGSPSSAVVCLDGYPMSRQGRGGVALVMTAIASFIGGSIGIILMMLFSPAIADIGLKFNSPEYFSLMLLGLVAASMVSSGSPVKSVSMVVLGLIIGMVGVDTTSGMARFTFGFYQLWDGVSLVAIAMGIFGVAEVIASVRAIGPRHVDVKAFSFRALIPTRDDVRRSWMPALRGSAIGSFFGTLPGTGAIVASFMAYSVEKRVSRDPSRFGNGAIEGVVAPEASNNAADQTSFIPTFTLGIPGSVHMALILGIVMIHGITPGPSLMRESPDLFWGLVMSFWIGNIMLLVLNIPLVGLWIRLLAIPYQILYPAILMFMGIGIYSINNSIFDVMLVVVFGIIGYAMRILKFSAAPLLLGLVLGPLMEVNMRRSLLLSRGDFMVFIERPLSAAFIVATILLIVWVVWSSLRNASGTAAASAR